jgi:hypothetical protein
MFNEKGGKGEIPPNEDDLPVFWRKLEFQHSRYNKNNKAFFKENDTLCERIARFFYFLFV